MSRLVLVFTFLMLLPSVTWSQAADSLIIKSIYFGGGSYYIDEEQIQEMQLFINEIDHIEHYEVVIFSHTDNIGGKEYNEWLSRKRSSAVYYELLKINVPKELIEIKDLGYENSLYTNRSHLGRIKNRRVDIILVPIVF